MEIALGDMKQGLGNGDPDYLDTLTREQAARVIAYHNIKLDPKGKAFNRGASGRDAMREKFGKGKKGGSS